MAVRFTAESQTYQRTVNLGTQSNYSVTCWVRLAVDRNTWQTAWCLANPAQGDHFAILQTSNSGTYMEFITSATFTAVPLVDMQVGVWYFFGVAMSGSTGVAVWKTDQSPTWTTVNITNQGAVNQATWQIGRSIYSGEWLNGCVTGVKWWSATLTEQELKDEAPYLEPVRTSGIRAYYKLITPSTVDDSGNGYDLTGGTGATQEPGPDGVAESPSTPVDLDDQGAADEALDVAASAPLADAGAGAETLLITRQVAAADEGTADDVLAAAAAVPLADEAGAAEALGTTAAAPLAEAGAGADVLTAAASLSLDDQGAVLDEAAAAAAVPLADEATAAEALVGGFIVPADDTGAADDALGVITELALAEDGEGGEVLQVAADLDVTDAAVSLDALDAVRLVGLPDTAAAADALAAVRLVGLDDVAAADEALLVSAAVPLADEATAAEALVGGFIVPADDTGTADEMLAIVRSYDIGPVGPPRRTWSIRPPRRGVAAARHCW